MSAALEHDPDDPDLLEAYWEYVRTLRLRQAKFGYILPVALVPAALSLDYFVYPELLGPILKSRLWCNIVLMPCWALLFTRYARRLLWFLGNAWLWSPMAIIAWMIYASEGARSPYYAGLNLVMLASCLLTTYRARESIAFCGTVIGSYVIACVLHSAWPPASALNKSSFVNGSLMFNNVYFLVATACVCVASAYFGSKRRFEDFRLRHELDVNNDRLTLTISKLKETEVQLVQSEKMNALGKLSAGLLHEVNNPLNFTFMALQTAQQEVGDNAELKETLADIQQGMSRIKGVISDLRTFAYPTALSGSESFPIADALTTALRLTAHELQNINVNRDAVNGQRVFGSQTHLSHVFMNLLMNAAHAVRTPDLGRDPLITVACEPRGGRLEVTVRDNGIGVKAANLSKLFEPFFTTKDVGQGTGLGLSICHTIILNHGGNIGITSEEGKWTQVTFDLPLADKH
ncbi:MAG TPA: HAMP domain-containing sensor histidine kinase [Tepidisphaeraceae bacterium]|jgi:two-component system sensor histidine kinase PhcS